jgi:pimeloyl-ACP methyl ester carboxylesterase
MPTALTDERVSTAIGKQQVFRGGSGRPLLYLHSATGEAAGQPALEELADSFEVVAPLFPGFGESEGIDRIDGPEDAAFHLLDLLDSMALDRPAVVGTSLGGWLALELACRWPERLSALVLVNPVGLHVEGAPIKEIFGRDPGELADDLFADQSHPMAQAAHQFSAMGQVGEVPFELVKPLLQALAATARIGWRPYLHNPKLAGRLHRVTVPALIVHGAEDRLVPAAHGRRYAELLPSARLVDVAGAGHLLTLERPAELARLTREWLVEHP